MAVLLKIASVRVSFIQIMQVRVQNKDKSVWKVDTLEMYQCTELRLRFGWGGCN